AARGSAMARRTRWTVRGTPRGAGVDALPRALRRRIGGRTRGRRERSRFSTLATAEAPRDDMTSVRGETLTSVLDRAAAAHGPRPALLSEHRSLDWESLRRESNQVA